MTASIKFQLNKSLFIRDPQDTNLGQKILKNSILLIDEIGFEAFNFKKLAQKINSAEKSIYRYFDNKHLLLLFLANWYWEWVHYLIKTNIERIENPEKRLEEAIKNLVLAKSENLNNEYINENLLHKVIINEGVKAYHTTSIDAKNQEGLFLSYKSLVNEVSNLILAVNPSFPYETSLASNLFEMASNQAYFAQHLPRMTTLDINANMEEDLILMLKFFTKKLLA